MSSAGQPGKRKGSESLLKQSSMGDFFSKPKDTDKKKKRKRHQKMSSFIWTRGSYLDTEEYRNNYPGKKDHPNLNDNYDFYMNQIPSKPDGDFIDKIHNLWWGDHSRLERHHGYIQWLFPIRDSGMNWHAQELQLHEIEGLKKETKAMKRVLKSYEMMLEFYGMELADQTNGTIERRDNWRNRFRHLNRSYHNYLRITRILKCLGEFGFEHLKAKFVKFVLYEGLIKNTLPNTIDSCMKYWVGVIRSDEQREDILNYYDELCEADREEEEDSDDDMYSFRVPRKDKKETAKSMSVAKASKSRVSGDDSSEDETLPYAMSLIDSDNENETSKKTATKARKEHEMSESEDEFQTPNADESQEAKYWETGQSSAGNSLQHGSDAVEDNTLTLDDGSNDSGEHVENDRSENNTNDTVASAGNKMQQDNGGENMDEGRAENQTENANVGTDEMNSKEEDSKDGIVKSAEQEVPVDSTETTGNLLQNSSMVNKESNVSEKDEKLAEEKLENHGMEENSDSQDGASEIEKAEGNKTEGKTNGKENQSGAAMDIPENQSTKDDSQDSIQQEKKVNIKPDGTEAEEEEMEVDTHM